MYLKFNRYRYKSGVTVFRACVVRAFRCPLTGSPRQKHIMTVPAVLPALADQSARLSFWVSLEKALSSLQITETDRERVRKSAGKRVARPAVLGV